MNVGDLLLILFSMSLGGMMLFLSTRIMKDALRHDDRLGAVMVACIFGSCGCALIFVAFLALFGIELTDVLEAEI